MKKKRFWIKEKNLNSGNQNKYKVVEFLLNTWISHLSLYINEPGAWPATQRKGSAVRCNECGASAVCGLFVSSFFAKVWSQTWMIFCGFLYLCPGVFSSCFHFSSREIFQIFGNTMNRKHFVWPKYLHWDPRRNCCISTVPKAMNQGLLIKFKQIKGKAVQVGNIKRLTGWNWNTQTNRSFKSLNVLNLQHGSSVFRFSTSVGANKVEEDRLSRAWTEDGQKSFPFPHPSELHLQVPKFQVFQRHHHAIRSKKTFDKVHFRDPSFES